MSRKDEEFGEEGEQKMLAPDGGYGYVILFGGFMLVALTALPVFTYGIIYASYLEANQCSSTFTAWIFGVASFIWNFCSLFIGPLCIQIGLRKMAIFSGVLVSCSQILSAFSPAPEFLFFTVSFLGGLGGGTGLFVSLMAASKYFDNKRGFALGIVGSGSCVTLIAGPFLIRLLQDNFGFKGSTFILGAILLNACAAGALFQPVEWHTKKKTKQRTLSVNEKELPVHQEMKKMRARLERKKTYSECSEYSEYSMGLSTIVEEELDSRYEKQRKPLKLLVTLFKVCKSTVKSLRYLRYLQVVFISVATSMMMLGYMNFQMWIPFAIADNGHSPDVAALSLSASSITNFVVRLLVSFLSDRKYFHRKTAYIAGNIMIALSIVAFTFFDQFTMTVIIVCIWGGSVGWVMSLNSLVMIDTMGLDMFPTTYGISALFISVSLVTIGPLIGFLRDVADNYDVSLRVLASFSLSSAIFWIAMPLASTFDKKRELKNKENINLNS